MARVLCPLKFSIYISADIIRESHPFYWRGDCRLPASETLCLSQLQADETAVGNSIENCFDECRDWWWVAYQSNCVQCIKLKVCLHHHTDHTLSLKRGTKLVKTKHSSYQICKSSQQRKYREDLTRRD